MEVLFSFLYIQLEENISIWDVFIFYERRSMYRVLKFGGTSVADTSKIKAIANYLNNRKQENEKYVIVASAMNKNTDLLIELANDVSTNVNSREYDQLLSIGEQQTIALLSMAINDLGLRAISLTASQIGIEAYGEYSKAKIKSISKELINKYFEDHDVLVVAGFQARIDDDVVTLGRGGSDTSAVAIASILNCTCEIYTDVNGIYSIDPRLRAKAKQLQQIDIDEMCELSSLGANVMHNRSIFLAKKFKTPIYVGKSLSDQEGTYIMENILEQNVVSGISCDRDVINISLSGHEHLNSKMLDLLSKRDVNIDMVSQLAFMNQNMLAFSALKADSQIIDQILNEIQEDHDVTVVKQNNLCKLSLVGTAMREESGVINKIYKCLKDNDIPIIQTSTSEITISVLIKQPMLEQALEVLSIQFELEEQC